MLGARSEYNSILKSPIEVSNFATGLFTSSALDAFTNINGRIKTLNDITDMNLNMMKKFSAP